MRIYFKGIGTALGAEYPIIFGKPPAWVLVGLGPITIPLKLLNLEFGISGELAIGFGEPE